MCTKRIHTGSSGRWGSHGGVHVRSTVGSIRDCMFVHINYRCIYVTPTRVLSLGSVQFLEVDAWLSLLRDAAICTVWYSCYLCDENCLHGICAHTYCKHTHRYT